MNILFPTDYSDNARNAFQFACNLAQKMDASITMMHAFNLPLIENAKTMDQLAHSITEVKVGQMDRLKKFISDFEVHATQLPIQSLEFDFLIEEGEANEAILTVINKGSFDLVIMGTKGISNIQSTQMGTITSTVIQQSAVPVLAIPANAQYRTIEKIMIAEDYDSSDEPALEMVKKLSQLFDAEINIVHLAEAKDYANNERKSNFNKIKQHIMRKIPKVAFKVLHGHNMVDTLENYLQEESMDLMFMVVRKQQNASTQSLVNQMVLNTSIPLLAFQE